MKKEEKEKIRQFNREIAEMKKETYNTFYRQASPGENSAKPRKTLLSGIIIRHFLFIIFFGMLSSGLWMLSGSLVTSGIYIGNSIIDYKAVIIPFLLGVFLLYFMKDTGVSLIIFI